MSSIADKMKNILVNSIDFMEGKEKADLVLGKEYTIIDFGELTGKDGKFAVFTTREDKEHFFFGGQVITEKLAQLKACLTEEELKEAKEEGIKVKFIEVPKTKTNNRYIKAEFIF